jgi:hypothetical protein
VGERPVVEMTVIGGCWEVMDRQERIVAREVVQTVGSSSVKGRRREGAAELGCAACEVGGAVRWVAEKEEAKDEPMPKMMSETGTVKSCLTAAHCPRER